MLRKREKVTIKKKVFKKPHSSHKKTDFGVSGLILERVINGDDFTF